MNTSPLAAADDGALLSEQVRSYDSCFGEFVQSAHNGQKHVQAILLREAFQRFNRLGVGIRKGAPTSVLDVSCGPGEYSTTWTTQIARYLPQGMRYFCTDFPGGTCKGTGEKYTTAAARKIKGAADEGKLVLSGVPIGIEADLFSGCDVIIPPGTQADIVHWSHSGYHVRDALGGRKNDHQAIESGLNTAVDKIWATLSNEGIFFSVHQTRDDSDGMLSEMFPVSHRYLGVISLRGNGKS
jgi:SAM-dependent methyltransferase